MQISGKENVTIEILDGAAHVDAAFETDENMERIADFLDQYLM